jgi:serine/threonine protein kinase
MQEGRMLARVRHENVVTVHGADVIDGVAGIWMELVHGETLDHLVKNGGPMPAHEAAAVSADIARALGAVHAAALLHCDVKAQNVVRETSGRVVLMDLGAGRLAPEARDLDQPSPTSPAHRATWRRSCLPTGAAATKATDIYSLGVLIYYLLSGEYPVDGKTLGELKRSHDARRMRPLADARRGLPKPLLDLVSRAHRSRSGGAAGVGRRHAGRPDANRERTSAPSRRAQRSTGGPPPRSPWPLAARCGSARRARRRPPLAAALIRTLAVLPIKNLTGDPSKQYVADGLTEVLISNLARIRSLRIPSCGGACFRAQQ